MSFSNNFVDKNPTSSVPDFDKAVQISEAEALRLQIAALPNAVDRRACTSRLNYAEEQAKQAEQRRKVLETHYVDKHLKLELSLELALGTDPKTHEQRVEHLRARFRRTPENMAVEQDKAQRQTDLMKAVTDRLDKALQQQTEWPLSKDQFKEQRTASALSRNFNRAVDR